LVSGRGQAKRRKGWGTKQKETSIKGEIWKEENLSRGTIGGNLIEHGEKRGGHLFLGVERLLLVQIRKEEGMAIQNGLGLNTPKKILEKERGTS